MLRSMTGLKLFFIRTIPGVPFSIQSVSTAIVLFSSMLFLIKCTCTCRLMEEKDKLQRKVNIMGDDKKDD